MSRLLNEASFSELMVAASKKLGRDECLILAYLHDSPNTTDAYVYIGEGTHYVPRDSIKAHRR